MTGAERIALRRVVALSFPRRGLLLASIACAALGILAAVALLAVSGALISKAALRPPVLSLGVLIVSVRALALVRALARYGERLSSHDVALRSMATLRMRFFEQLTDRQLPARSELLSRFVADVDRLQDLYLRALTPPVVAAVCAVATSAVAALLLPAVGVIVLIALLVAGGLVPLLATRLAGRGARRQAPARARLTAAALETSVHGAELALLGLTAQRSAQLRDADAELARLARRDALAGATVSTLGGLVQAAAVLGSLVVAIPATASGRLDGILLAALVLMTLAAFESVAALPAAAIAVAGCASAGERITAIVDASPEITDPARPVTPAPGADLHVRAVDVVVEGGLLLDELDLHLRAGERIAITGPSGAGKTTLAELLVRFRDPDAGSVRLGDVDVRRLALGELRRDVRLIAQDAGLFTTTVAENVRLARPGAGDAEIRAALLAVGLGGWLDAQPAGLQTMIGEDGATVSGGERRRIALARALVADARVLVVDEPTAHLDSTTSQLVLDALLDHAGAYGQGLIAIVHPGCDLSGFDRVLELRGGRLAPA